MSLVLGLDVSTSCTGWCISDKDGNFIDMDYVCFKKIGTCLSKADLMKTALIEINKNYQISRIVIEENLQAFRPGLSSAKTLMTLASFNGIVSYICREVFSIDPEYINVNVARRLVGLKIDRKSNATTKEQVLEWVKGTINPSGYSWPTKTLKSGPRKGMVVAEPGCYDMADAFVVCTAACI